VGVRRRAGRRFDPSAQRFPGKERGALTADDALPDLAVYVPLVARAHPGARNSYEALDPATHSRVEIELIESSGATRSHRRQVLNRARQLIELSIHPHICPVRNLLELPDGRLGLVVAYRTWSLADAIAQGGPATPAQAVNVGLGLASALAALEGAGLSHLALCPENILLAAGGDVEIAGFASLVTGGIRLAPFSQGTELVRHAAPEVLEGFAAGLPADVYSLGSVIYKMLIGLAPFEVLPGESAAAFALRVLAEPAPVLRAGIPEDLRELVGSLLAKRPSERPASSAECSAALDGIRQRHGWHPEGLRVPRTKDGPLGISGGSENTATGTQTAAVTGEGSSLGADATLSVEDRSADGPPRIRGSRRALERPLADTSRTEHFPAALRGQPQLPLRAPDEPLDPLEHLKDPNPALAKIPESPIQADGISQVDEDSVDLPGPAARYLGVGARWGRASGARGTLPVASRADTASRVPSQGRREPTVRRRRRGSPQRRGGSQRRGEKSRPGHLPLVAKALIVAAAMVIALAALVALGVV